MALRELYIETTLFSQIFGFRKRIFQAEGVLRGAIRYDWEGCLIQLGREKDDFQRSKLAGERWLMCSGKKI